MRMRIKKKKEKQNTGVLPDVLDATIDDGDVSDVSAESEVNSTLDSVSVDEPEALAAEKTEGNENHEKIQAESALDFAESTEVSDTDKAADTMLELDSKSESLPSVVPQENVVQTELDSSEKVLPPQTSQTEEAPIIASTDVKTTDTANSPFDDDNSDLKDTADLFDDFDMEADYSGSSDSLSSSSRNAPMMNVMDEPYPYVGASAVPIVDTVDGAVLYIPMERISNPDALFKPRKTDQLPYDDETIVYEKEYGKFEVIAGGYIRCRVIDAADQDDAKLMQLDYAQKKYQLSHSERIQAYADELAIYLASGDNEEEAITKIADLNGVHMDTVEAYLQLNKLLPQLVAKIDKGITIAGAEILATMSPEDQRTIIDAMNDLSLPFLSAGQIREISKVSSKRSITTKDVAEITQADAITITKQQFEDAVYDAVHKMLQQVEKR